MTWTILATACCQQTTIPIPQIAFAMIASICGIYSYNLFKHYHVNHNPLALLHAQLTLFATISLYLLSVPLIFTVNRTVLLWSDYASGITATVFFIVLAKIVWFAGLRTRVSFRYIAIPLLLIGAAILISDILYLDVNSTAYPATYIKVPLSLWLRSLLLTVVMLPSSIWYFRQALRTSDRRQQLRLGVIAIILLVMALSIVSQNIILGGKDSPVIGDIQLAAGVLTLIVIVITRKKEL